MLGVCFEAQRTYTLTPWLSLTQNGFYRDLFPARIASYRTSPSNHSRYSP